MSRIQSHPPESLMTSVLGNVLEGGWKKAKSSELLIVNKQSWKYQTYSSAMKENSSDTSH